MTFDSLWQKMRGIAQEAVSLPYTPHANPKLWILDSFGGNGAPVYREVPSPSELGHRKPLLFVHGVDYGGPEDVLKDLVLPFERWAQLSRHQNYDCYFITWDSRIVTPDIRMQLTHLPPLARVGAMLAAANKWRHLFANVEQRGIEAAEYLEPFFDAWTSGCSHGPAVVSHSLGSFVWAHVIKNQVVKRRWINKPGLWWNMQAAMPLQSVLPGGEFSLVPKIYSPQNQGTMLLWFSKLDLILSTLYVSSKPGWALGQWGCRDLYQKDITRLAGEAHGSSHLNSALGPLFQRVGPILKKEAEQLGF